ncbi:MAG: 8-amino-7-oxononanoate synthase [Pseudomonadota bacterium]
MTAGPADTWAREALADLDARGLRRTLEPLERWEGMEVLAAGRRCINFASNDYLGLAGVPTLAEDSHDAWRRLGAGSGGSRLVTGDHALHHAVEDAAARILRAPTALLYPSGYAANTGILPVLAGDGDALFSDARNHASIVDGCRLSRASVTVYPHHDVDALDRMLAASTARRRVVVTESLFSMDGDVAPLAELVTVCARHGAALVVDEAHAFGIFGPGGAGLVAELGLEDRVDVRVVTLGKAAGAAGALVAGTGPLTAWLWNRSRPFVYSTAMPPALCAMAIAGLQRLETGDALREALRARIAHFSSGLRARGYAADAGGPIVPIVYGTPRRALDAMEALRCEGIYVRAMRPPTVPEGTSRLRFSLSAAHTTRQLDVALDALGRCPVRP